MIAPPATPAPARDPPALVLIAAVARNGVIGAGNALPWRLPDDVRRFRLLTTGHAVIMGRRTWQSLPRALPDRQNIVLSGHSAFAAVDAEVAVSLPAALALVRRPAPVYCIGGGEIYTLALPYADTLCLTEIDAEVPGDVHFPSFDRRQWEETERSARMSVGALAYTYVTWRRTTPPAPAKPA